MKFKSYFAVLAIAAMVTAACDNNLLPEQPGNEHEIYTVHLTCGGEVEMSQQPLTRFTPDNNDLYGIQVSYKPVSGGSYKDYAYGLFDDISDLTIDLISDHTFKICVDLIDDGKNKVYSDGIQIDSVNYTGYGYPFQALNNYSGKSENTITKVSNEFVYSKEHYFKYLGTSFQVPGSNSYDWCPEGVESYYGITEVTPTADGETISVFLKRMVYGIKIIADDFLTEGVVNVKFDRYSSKAFTLTPDNKVVEKTYTYNNRASWYRYEELEDASDYIWVDFSWTKDDGTVLKLKRQTIYFNRLKQTIINLTFYEDTTIDDAKIGMQYEDQVFVEEGQNIYNLGDDQDEYSW